MTDEAIKRFRENFLSLSNWIEKRGLVGTKQALEDFINQELQSQRKKDFEAGRQEALSEERRLLKLIDKLVSGDVGFEADCVELDILQDRKVDKKTEEFAELIMKIYKITHPVFSKCSHPDWEKETDDLLTHFKELKK